MEAHYGKWHITLFFIKNKLYNKNIEAEIWLKF